MWPPRIPPWDAATTANSNWVQATIVSYKATKHHVYFMKLPHPLYKCDLNIEISMPKVDTSSILTCVGV